MGAGMIFGALAGAGDALDKYATNRQRMDDEQRLMEERNKAEIMRQEAIERNRMKIQSEPLNRFSTILKDELNKEVSVAPEDVKNIGSASAKEVGLEDGLSGNVEQLRNQWKKVLADPNATAEQRESAAGILSQIDSQVKGQGLINQRDADGKTRKVSNDEAFEAAYRRAIAEDPSAAIAVQSIRKDDRSEKKLDADIAYQKDRNARLEKKEDDLNAWRMRSEERRQTLAEDTLRWNKLEMEARTDREKQQAINGQRAATLGALNNVEKEINSLRKELADPMLDKEKKSMLEGMRDAYTREAKQYRSALAANGFDLPPMEAAPAPFEVGTIKNGYKYLGGDYKDQKNWEPVASDGPSAKASTRSEVTPPPPEKKRWVGNEYLVTPEYEEWEKKYGAQFRSKSSAKESLIVDRLSHSKL